MSALDIIMPAPAPAPGAARRGAPAEDQDVFAGMLGDQASADAPPASAAPAVKDRSGAGARVLAESAPEQTAGASGEAAETSPDTSLAAPNPAAVPVAASPAAQAATASGASANAPSQGAAPASAEPNLDTAPPQADGEAPPDDAVGADAPEAVPAPATSQGRGDGQTAPDALQATHAQAQTRAQTMGRDAAVDRGQDRLDRGSEPSASSSVQAADASPDANPTAAAPDGARPASAAATSGPAAAGPAAGPAASPPPEAAAAPPLEARPEGETADTARAAETPAPPAPREGAASGLARATLETTALLSAQIIRRLEMRSTRFEMALTPEGLGRVDVSMEIDSDGQLAARLAFDNPAAAAEMRGRVDELRRQLEQAGFQLSEGALEFADREGGGRRENLFERGAGRAFAGAGRLISDSEAAAPAPRWMSLSLAPSGVDMKV